VGLTPRGGGLRGCRSFFYFFSNFSIMDKPIYTIVEEDMQMVARERIGRDLTDAEMRSAVRYFENGIQWAEVAEVAVDLAVEDHK